MRPEFCILSKTAARKLARNSHVLRIWNLKDQLQTSLDRYFGRLYPSIGLRSSRLDFGVPVAFSDLRLDSDPDGEDALVVSAISRISEADPSGLVAVQFGGVWLFKDGTVRDSQFNWVNDDSLRLERYQKFAEWYSARLPEKAA